jgi:hypothetical protein
MPQDGVLPTHSPILRTVYDRVFVARNGQKIKV